MNHPERLKLNEAADYSRKSPRTIRRYIAEGLLPAYRVGPRDILILRADLDELLRPIPTVRKPHVAPNIRLPHERRGHGPDTRAE